MASANYSDITGRVIGHWSGGGGGGSQPVQAVYSATAPVTITDGSFAQLPFDNLDSGTELLDRSTPNAATFLAAGMYAVTAAPSGNAVVTAGGFIDVSVIAGALGTSGAFTVVTQGVPLAAVLHAEAGDTLAVGVSNFDGGAVSQDFRLNPFIVVKLA